MTLAINSPAAQMREMGQHVDGPIMSPNADPLADARTEYVIQVLQFGRWAKWCSSLDNLPEAEARVAAERKAVPFREFRIVRAVTTFEVIA